MLETGWIVLRTQARHEILAAGAVDARGVEQYVPLVRQKLSAERVQPLFPGYVFARISTNSDDLVRIRSAPGVAYVLPLGGPPTIMPDIVIDVIRRRLSDCPEGLRPPDLRPGDRVQMISGPFRWMDAVFDRRLSADGRVRILLELAHRTVHFNVPESELQRA